ncbi:uncharacterized protein LOC101243400 [Ciona intestinalis]
MRFDERYFDYQTIVDYVILDSNWYNNSNGTTCTSERWSDTTWCWNGRLAELVRRESPFNAAGRSCIAQFVSYASRGGITGRGKRQSGLQSNPISSGDIADYNSCFTNHLHLPDDRNPINVPTLTRFIQNHTMCSTRTDIQDCRTNETTRDLAQRNFGYRLDGLTRPDSPLRNAITYCNRDVFPIVETEPVQSTNECYSGFGRDGDSWFRRQRCAPYENACQTKFIVNGRTTMIMKTCKHRDACMSNFSGNRQNCFSEEAMNNRARVCHFCCTGDLCNNSDNIQDY